MRVRIKYVLIISSTFLLLIAMACLSSQLHKAGAGTNSRLVSSLARSSCTSFCLDEGDHCVFGTNMDNSLQNGYLYVNKRRVLKTTWDPSTSGEYARWISRYGSVTVNFVSYQMAWGGMNEAGLMISTMSLNKTKGPRPDSRIPFQSPFWLQYQLDMHSTVKQVIASDSDIRLPESQTDHYLVCDRTGDCAVIELLDGKLVYYAAEALPVKALTNSTYEISLQATQEIHQEEGEGYGNSLRRFVAAAERLAEYEPVGTDQAVSYAFDTLDVVSREDTVWSFVYDPLNLRIHFRTWNNPQIRSLDFTGLDFSCQAPVQMLDVHANVSGNIGKNLLTYNHAASFDHGVIFFTQYEGFSMSPFLVDTLLRGVESFPCRQGETTQEQDIERYRPLIPPTIIWAFLAVLHRLWPIWLALLGLSLACLLWLMPRDMRLTRGRRLLWLSLAIVLGPVSVALYWLARRRKTKAIRPFSGRNE